MIALSTIGISALLLPFIPNLFYLLCPHLGIGFGIGAIDSALMPMLAEFVDESLVSQYGYVYTASQTASSIAYAVGPLLGGALINYHCLSFESLMRSIGVANLLLATMAYINRSSFEQTFERRLSLKGRTATEKNNGDEIILMQQLNPSLTKPNYQRFD
ncbi:synaptic vesicular amine transporter-like protein [Sarcoptes scabiei]|nr:synaptic vesicular amine transporter-like protein [Sarcoptes scabiei]